MNLDIHPNVLPVRPLVERIQRANAMRIVRKLRAENQALKSALAAERKMNDDLAMTAEAMRKCMEMVPTAFQVFIQREGRVK